MTSTDSRLVYGPVKTEGKELATQVVPRVAIAMLSRLAIGFVILFGSFISARGARNCHGGGVSAQCYTCPKIEYFWKSFLYWEYTKDTCFNDLAPSNEPGGRFACTYVP